MPRNESRDTKEVILTVALKLFSERGYDGIGIRDISKEIGIRESALYKHYSSKQEIFDSIILKMNNSYEQEVASFQLSKQMASTIKGGYAQESLVKMCMLMFEIYLKDESGSQLRRMLTFEQLKNTEVGNTFRTKIIDDGLNYISNAFAELIRQDYYQEADPYVMAIQFYSPLYLLLTKYDRQSNKYDEALDYLEKHIKQFDFMYRKDGSSK